MAEPYDASIPELKTYKGNCHCGAFKFKIQIPELTSVTECNCSICFRKGYKWIFPPGGSVSAASCFYTIEKGDDGSLKDYEFGKRSLLHKFCPTCGTGIMKQQRHGMMDIIAINARALQDVDLWSLKVNRSDGAALEPFYEPPSFMGPEPPATDIENGKLYTGSCHCGVVTMALKAKGPLDEEVEIIGECDCSICARMGRILTYRPPAQIFVCLAPGTTLSSYSFAGKIYEHKFCPICGVAVGVDDTEDNMKAVNLRCFGGVEWGSFETFKNKGSTFDPLYVVPK